MSELTNDQISDKGFWLTPDARNHCYDEKLANKLKELFTSHDVLDLGCGPGQYTRFFLDNDIPSEGWDGNPNTNSISDGLCNVADLTQVHDFGQRDWVLSLEVGEHIPKEYENIFIQNLIKHAKKGIVLSWAIPNQPGDGHVNCQSNEYVIDLMAKNGFLLDAKQSYILREEAELWWFKNTLMVFTKNETPKITFCIPSKTNLRYLKTCIPSIRKNAYRKDHDIIVFVDSDEDGTVEWLEQVKDEYNVTYYVNPELGKSLYGIGKAYDYCIEKSTTDVFMIFHADMMLGKDADMLAFHHLKPRTVVCATRVEPPIHPNAGEKILMDFGMWPEEFKEKDFDAYVASQFNMHKTTNGVFAPWMMYKEDLLAIGGHDSIMHSCREDSDIFNRMSLAGYTFVQPWNSLVYHLTGRGAGSFDGDEERHRLWQMDMEKSTKEFIRKWGSNVKHTDLMEPIISPKYNIALVVSNCNLQLLEVLEPWCDRIYVNEVFKVIGRMWDYVELEQENTSFDLSKRVHTIEHNDPILENDIVVEFDATQLNQQSFQIIQQLPDILKESGEVGTFELDIFKVTINSLTEYQKDLVICKN
jgi:glycosyltransferase involved in cell wall biosynthesis